MKTYKIEFELCVDKVWVEDGITCETLKKRIGEELPSDLCPYAYGGEIFVKNLKVKVKK